MKKLVQSDSGGPQRIDRYDLVAEIATGGMATVYLARLSGMGGFQRNVAVKLLHPHLAKNADFVQMFFDEARLAASIHHPNVVPILEVGQGQQGYYLVMEYIEGDTFASLLSKAATAGRKVPLDVALRVVIDMLAGLHAAHELRDDRGLSLGLVHRDVSPQNILVGTDGVTRITDFGVARAASRLSETRAGQLKGKLAYMAPEQVQGEEDIDRRVDVFSAGVVLWEALSLKRLFKASNEAATLTRVLTDPIVSPCEENSDVPQVVAAVCLKALERDLNRRYVSCAEFADALERAAIEAKILATPRDVATYVAEVVGDELESHRKAIREWLDRHERSGAQAASSPSRTSLPPPPPPRRASSSGPPPRSSGRVARPVPSRPASEPLPQTDANSGLQLQVFADQSSTPFASLYPPPSPARELTSTLTTAPLHTAEPPSRRKLWPLIAGAALFGALVFAWVWGNSGTEPAARLQPESPVVSGQAPDSETLKPAPTKVREVSELDEFEPAATSQPPPSAVSAAVPGQQVSKPSSRPKVAPKPARRKPAPPRATPDLENPYQ